MYVLTLTPEEAAHYYDTHQKRSYREISFARWTLSGDPEPGDYTTAEEHDAWYAKQKIDRLTREELDGLVLEDDQELRVDAAVWVQRIPSPKNPTGLAIFSHEMVGDDPNHHYNTVYPYYMTYVLGLWNKEEAERLIADLVRDSEVVYNNPPKE